jgi:hypothetical protein
LGEVQLRINGTSGGFDWFRRNAGGAVSTEGVTTDVPAIANSWQYVVATYDGSSYSLYINGALHSVPCPYCFQYVADQGSDTKIGTADIGDNFYFNGLIDEVQVFNVSLSASEVQTLYNTNIRAAASQHRLDN